MYSYIFGYLVPTRSVRDFKKCRKILQRAVQSASDNPEMVIQALLSFEREEGEWSHALYWNLNKLKLHLFLDFASTLILPKTCPALSWDQALLSFFWVNRFRAGKANRKVSHLVQHLCTWITCACESTLTMIVASLVSAFMWLPWYQTDLKRNTRAFEATYHAYQLVQHGHPKNVNRIKKNLAIQLKVCRWPRISGFCRPHQAFSFSCMFIQKQNISCSSFSDVQYTCLVSKRASLSTVVCYSQRHYWQSSCYCLKNVVLSMFGLISGIEFSSNWTLNCALLVLGTLEDWDAAFSKCRVQLLRVNERRQKVRKATQICPLKTTQVKM